MSWLTTWKPIWGVSLEKNIKWSGKYPMVHGMCSCYFFIIFHTIQMLLIESILARYFALILNVKK